MKRAMGAAVLAAFAALPAGAIELTLDRRDLEEAVEIAYSTIQANHLRFHADYRFTVAKPPIDFVEIVSPFRRVVLSAETDRGLGRGAFGQQEALAALRPDPDRVEVFVELTFHPLNTFIGVPDYDVALLPVATGALPVRPTAIDRIPREGPRMDARYPFPYPYDAVPRAPAGSQPLLGGTLIARFNGALLDPKGVYEVVVKDGEKELGRTRRIDLLRLR